MLLDVGCKYVIIGHSDAVTSWAKPMRWSTRSSAALAAGLHVILCVGETLQERQEKRAEEVFFRQVAAGFAGLDPAALAKVVLAYEPVWAIGTGHTATPEQAQQAHAAIRGHIAKDFSENVAAGASYPLRRQRQGRQRRRPVLAARRGRRPDRRRQPRSGRLPRHRPRRDRVAPAHHAPQAASGAGRGRTVDEAARTTRRHQLVVADQHDPPGLSPPLSPWLPA